MRLRWTRWKSSAMWEIFLKEKSSEFSVFWSLGSRKFSCGIISMLSLTFMLFSLGSCLSWENLEIGGWFSFWLSIMLDFRAKCLEISVVLDLKNSLCLEFKWEMLLISEFLLMKDFMSVGGLLLAEKLVSSRSVLDLWEEETTSR